MFKRRLSKLYAITWIILCLLISGCNIADYVSDDYKDEEITNPTSILADSSLHENVSIINNETSKHNYISVNQYNNLHLSGFALIMDDNIYFADGKGRATAYENQLTPIILKA